MSIPRNQPVDGPEFTIRAKTPDGDVFVRVDFNGNIGHTEFYGSGKCSWKNTLKVWAVITIRAGIPFAEKLDLWESDAGSHYSGVKGTCGSNRSLIDGNWREAKKELDSKTLGAMTFFKERVEDFLRSKQPAISSIDWDVVELE